MYSQNIDGRWMHVRDPSLSLTPVLEIMRIEMDSIYIYDYNNLIEKGPAILEDRIILYKDTLTLRYTLANNNKLNVNSSSTKENTAKYPLEFIKLTQTKGELINSLTSNTYIFPFFKPALEVRIGEEIHDNNILYIKNKSFLVNKIIVEYSEGTYFLSFYLRETRKYTFPIREIFKDSFSVYGVPGFSNELLIKRVNE
ncbi:hypothetical protein ACFSQJ_15920 [Croceitalea marina]|uniref:DUF3108 domain-containing protein n=1 Tax=Croceitalea marina TaxID=1775166 RepID=A0ABW5N0R0_9FLAO